MKVVINTMASKHTHEHHDHKSLDPRITDGNLKFSIDLYKTSVDVCGNDNIFISPFSISMAVVMTYPGARNETAHEIKKTLHLDAIEDDQSLHSTFSNIMRSLTSDIQGQAPYQLHIANKMYLEKSYSVEDNFVRMLVEHYLTEVAKVNFSDYSEDTRQQINAWVEETTNNKIKNLIPEGGIDALTRLVLVNAIYFKGNWATQFRKNLTKKGDFFRKRNDSVKTMFMFKNDWFGFTQNEELKCKVLRMKYLGERLSMLILLPEDIEGLTMLESKLTSETLKSLIDSLYERKVEVTIPKFKLESTLPLKKILQKLGIQKLFSIDEADLTGISSRNDLYASDCFHKAFVDVNEEGTEAAAATAMAINFYCAGGIESPIFTADHPFVFLIYDDISQLVLFIGRVTDPPTY